MGDTIYLAAAYGVFWLVSFVLIYSIANRQRHLQKDIAMLEQLAQEETSSE
ncbi:MAG: hypothetical protein KDJ65_08315 [Anaerolineae bacterium]|nr:hypothetical protein [Anaerolineae bacterium]